MPRLIFERSLEQGEFVEEKIIVDNTPDIGDRSGIKFLECLEEAISECKNLIERGFRLADYWTDPDVGIVFSMKKKRI